MDKDSDEEYGYMVINTNKMETTNSFVEATSLDNHTESFEEVQTPEFNDLNHDLNKYFY